MLNNFPKKLLVAIIILFPAVATYYWQNNRLNKFNKENEHLSASLSSLQTEFDALNDTGAVSTESWKQYCDTINAFCFKYPPDWTLEDSGNAEFGYEGATIKNLAKTIAVVYANPLVKDGGYHSAKIVELSQINSPLPNLRIVGSYQVASTVFHPEYSVINTLFSEGLVQGEVGKGISNPRFDYGNYTSVMLASRWLKEPNGINSKARADAWFQSVEGKTVKAILSSLAEQKSSN